MKLHFVSKHSEASDVVTYIFAAPTPLSALAGQYFHYVLPHADADDRGTERWFTNSAAPSEGHVQISTRLSAENGSSFKKALDALQPGKPVEADGPEGSFVIDDFSRNYIFVAGGIGITPFRSILVEAARRGSPLKATLLYGNRSNDIAFRDELDNLAAGNKDLTVNYLINPQQIDAALIKRDVDSVVDPLVYLSGPEPMVKGLAAELRQLGVADTSIKLDDFPGYEAI